jgi:hypothetical protein
VDAVEFNLVGKPEQFGGMQFNYVARMQMPSGFDTERDQSAQAYHPTQIRRVSTYEFHSGQPVFLLRSPDEITWVLQTFTDHVDPTLTELTLPGLGSRLSLPPGWQFKAATLDRGLSVATNGLANIVSDNLSNMYQGCLDGVNNFDPWG